MDDIGVGIISGLVTSLIGILIFHHLLKIEDVKNAIVFTFKWCRDNTMQVITGNDGNVSHTRIINIIWCFAALRIVAHSVYNNIHIQVEVLIFMAAAMGFNMAQTVINKTQEVKQAIAVKKIDDKGDE